MNEIENYQVTSSGYSALKDEQFNLGVFPGLLKKIIENRMWERRRLPNGKLVELNSLVELITTKPMDGWGEDLKTVAALLSSSEDRKAEAMFWDVLPVDVGGRPIREEKPNDNIMRLSASQGTSRRYALTRLKREHPDLYEEVCNGELSANAAAIKAGFRKKPTPYEIVIKQLDKLTPAELEEVRETISALFLAI